MRVGGGADKPWAVGRLARRGSPWATRPDSLRTSRPLPCTPLGPRDAVEPTEVASGRGSGGQRQVTRHK